jgi:hypothetical protein
LFPGEQVHSSGKSANFPGNHIISLWNRSISRWNRIILPGNRPNSRETISFFRETSLFPGEQYHISGKTVYFPENITFFRETELFPGEQHQFSGKKGSCQQQLSISHWKLVYFPGNSTILPGKKFVSRKTASHFRKKIYFQVEIIQLLLESDSFPGESYRFPGKMNCLMELYIVTKKNYAVLNGNVDYNTRELSFSFASIKIPPSSFNDFTVFLVLILTAISF